MLRAWNRFRDALVRRVPALDPSHAAYRWLVLAGVMIGTFMAVLDVTIVNVALAKLMRTFGVSVDRVDWVLTGYLLIFGVVLPSSGWFADHLGYKRVFILGLLLFTVGSFLCSLAWSLNVLIAFRIIQGAGAGFVMPVGLAIITHVFPPERRGIALGFWSMASSASVSLGPTLGGYLIDRFSWHTIFDVNVPIGIVGVLVLLVILREYKAERTRAFDGVGFVSLSVFLTGLLLALSFGNSAWNVGGWTSPFILTCFGLAALGLVTFLVNEWSVEHPLLDLTLFANFNFAISNGIMFLFGLGMFGSTFLLPIFLQDMLGYTPLSAGSVFLPVGIIQGLSSPLAGFYTDRHNPKLPLIIGLLIMAATFFQFRYLSLQSMRSQIMLPLYFRGFAMGILFPPLTTLAISNVASRKMAQASAMINVIRQIGGSVGVALFGSILIRRTIFHTAVFGQSLDPNSEAYRAFLRSPSLEVHGSASATRVANGLLQSFVERQGFVSAIDDVFLAAGVILLITVVPVVLLRVSRGERTPGGAMVE